MLLSLISLFYILPSKIYAANIPTHFDIPLPASYAACFCSDADAPPVCANTQNDNNCDYPRCDGGNAWSKYQRNYCIRDTSVEDSDCEAYYYTESLLYSIGDKCTGNYPYLDSGSCSSPYAISRYKACCSSGSLSANSCVPFDSDGAGDSEGRCPAGSYEVFCGFGSYPACSSSSVCGSAPVSSSAPAPTPPPVTCENSSHDPNPFPQCGVSCSDSQTL